MSVNRPRLVINGLALAALGVSLFVGNDVLSLVLILACLVCALAVLYRNLPALTQVSGDSPKLKTVRFVTVFNIAVIAAVAAFAILLEKELITLSERQSKYLLSAMLAVLMAVFGNIAPKLPFSRYTGLRLPWTVRDEETWIMAHRVLGYISLPLALLCLAGASMRTPFQVWVKLWCVGPVLVWIAIPGGLSLLFYWRKFHGRL